MKISMIAAMAHDRIIGNDNSMPWHLPADFTWFKRCTLGKPIVMGRKTFESIGRPLPGRLNIVISRNPHFSAEGITVVNDIAAAKLVAGDVPELMIIGGGSIYQACLPIADRLYLTFIDADLQGDTQFPEWGDHWQVVTKEHYNSDDKNAYAMEFVILERS
ncbi:type 3 dihydrofolate reductase [Photobacterium kishitanii]|uniref:Dihydrofolate reductase n=1 Tax=Photobacterium kishitanii TaxID=318456 RepID=A0A2T3KCC9_9GAMM|nr:type 3 dihydrofolate reductase [Photobacterium kishitanii]KJG59227.1 diacylglycerol kinase [Photobacterium kishitanii]KJG62223.1 diacylglycerol kinase [Photobacterium kishitanii]KJG67378.1 diacylglycerol kinase [Photobacterium kishitanii]KJG69420.1 diacylglycerol kinase [Photobacterium kishitanii]OBU28209.1 diacylglycerol kinase [Photobacterium kishitanii]